MLVLDARGRLSFCFGAGWGGGVLFNDGRMDGWRGTSSSSSSVVKQTRGRKGVELKGTLLALAQFLRSIIRPGPVCLMPSPGKLSPACCDAFPRLCVRFAQRAAVGEVHHAFCGPRGSEGVEVRSRRCSPQMRARLQSHSFVLRKG